MCVTQARNCKASRTHDLVSCSQISSLGVRVVCASALMYACLPCSACITAVCEPFQQPCTCVNTLTYPLACVDTLTHPLTYPLACVNTLTHPLADIYTRTLSNPQICPNIHALAHTKAICHTSTHACSYASTHACSHSSSHTCSHASGYACCHASTNSRCHRRCSVLDSPLTVALSQVSTMSPHCLAMLTNILPVWPDMLLRC